MYYIPQYFLYSVSELDDKKLMKKNFASIIG